MMSESESDLTSLHWLQNLTVHHLSNFEQDTSNPMKKVSSCTLDTTTFKGKETDDKNHPPCQKRSNNNNTVEKSARKPSSKRKRSRKRRRKCGSTKINVTQLSSLDVAAPEELSTSSTNFTAYKVDPAKKPPYSYAALICLAMRNSPARKMTLSQIYAWIKEQFAFYRSGDRNWEVSV